LADLELLMAEYGEVIDNAAIHRFELPVRDEVAAAYYAIEDGGIVFTHTEVPFVFSAQGYGSKLTRGASKRHVRAGCT
jgi:predicted GNAT family acetyltransferase